MGEDKSRADVGILTFHDALNYGAILQCYALYTELGKLGKKPEVINYVCPTVRNAHWPMPITKAKSLRKALELLVRNASVKKPRFEAFSDFKTECLTLSEEASSDGLDCLASRYRNIVVGSDQVWNPRITNGDETFFLGFADEKTNRLSYAASMGLSSLPDEYSTRLVESLKTFGAVSVRESIAKEMIESRNAGVSPEIVCDPVFLLDREDWEALAKTRPFEFDSPYVFMYVLKIPDKKWISLAKDQASRMNKQLIVLSQGVLPLRADADLKSCDPRQWIDLIRNADLVLTDSFHGTCFSLLFGKPIISLSREKALATSSRISELLERVGLGKEAFGSNRILKADDAVLQEYFARTRESSVRFLERNLR